jgi:hypothetical protein
LQITKPLSDESSDLLGPIRWVKETVIMAVYLTMPFNYIAEDARFSDLLWKGYGRYIDGISKSNSIGVFLSSQSKAKMAGWHPDCSIQKKERRPFRDWDGSLRESTGII